MGLSDDQYLIICMDCAGTLLRLTAIVRAAQVPESTRRLCWHCGETNREFFALQLYEHMLLKVQTTFITVSCQWSVLQRVIHGGKPYLAPRRFWQKHSGDATIVNVHNGALNDCLLKAIVNPLYQSPICQLNSFHCNQLLWDWVNSFSLALEEHSHPSPQRCHHRHHLQCFW
jgi:hypothetical protein